MLEKDLLLLNTKSKYHVPSCSTAGCLYTLQETNCLVTWEYLKAFLKDVWNNSSLITLEDSYVQVIYSWLNCKIWMWHVSADKDENPVVDKFIWRTHTVLNKYLFSKLWVSEWVNRVYRRFDNSQFFKLITTGARFTKLNGLIYEQVHVCRCWCVCTGPVFCASQTCSQSL